jgi:Raf kinase inhibitor-like YbhB/YbcL family protein
MNALAIGSAFVITFAMSAPAAAQDTASQPRAPAMTLSTTAFPDGGQFPVKYSQAAQGSVPGENISPPLTWANAPAGTRSFVLHVHDLDVAKNKTTEDSLHWLVWNIPPTATGLPEGVKKGAKLPDGSSQINANGPEYRGPGAPASGPYHHYAFELIALDTVLDPEPTGDGSLTRIKVFAALQGHILGKAVYSALFRRPN